jgi:hypothetical protein
MFAQSDPVSKVGFHERGRLFLRSNRDSTVCFENMRLNDVIERHGYPNASQDHNNDGPFTRQSVNLHRSNTYELPLFRTPPESQRNMSI